MIQNDIGIKENVMGNEIEDVIKSNANKLDGKSKTTVIILLVKIIVLLLIMIGLGVLYRFFGYENITEAILLSIFSSGTGGAIFIILSLLRNYKISKKNSGHPELPKFECPFNSIPNIGERPCHAPHIIAYDNLQSAWQYILDELLKSASPRISILKVYAATANEVVRGLSNFFKNASGYEKICIDKIQFIIKSDEGNVLHEKGDGHNDLNEMKSREIFKEIEFAEIPKIMFANKRKASSRDYHLTHYMCVIDESFVIFGCNSDTQEPKKNERISKIDSQRPFVASHKTLEGKKLVEFQSENFDIIYEKLGLKFKPYSQNRKRSQKGG